MSKAIFFLFVTPSKIIQLCCMCVKPSKIKVLHVLLCNYVEEELGGGSIACMHVCPYTMCVHIALSRVRGKMKEQRVCMYLIYNYDVYQYLNSIPW